MTTLADDLNAGSAIHEELQRAVDEAERDLAEGRWLEHSEVVAHLQRLSKKAEE
jgi:predicted transcriptional regulator